MFYFSICASFLVIYPFALGQCILFFAYSHYLLPIKCKKVIFWSSLALAVCYDWLLFNHFDKFCLNAHPILAHWHYFIDESLTVTHLKKTYGKVEVWNAGFLIRNDLKILVILRADSKSLATGSDSQWSNGY